MRIRLIHTQSLLLISAILLTVLLMGALNAWNLRNGFSEFLATRDIDRLEQFATLVSQNAEQAGSMAALKGRGLGMHDLFRQFGAVQMRHPLRSAPHDLINDPINPRLKQPLHPPHSQSDDAFKNRVSIYGLDGHPLLGKSLTTDSNLYVERPVRINNEIVATIRMVKLKPVPDEVETQFLRSQYSNIAIAAGLLVLAALMGAYWVARHWVKPLTEVQTATERIAKGAFGVRLNATRTDEIGDTMRNINLMAIGLQKLETTRRRWMADMSHELRTPLTVLRGEIEALIDGITPLKPSAILSLKEEVQQLSALVDDLHLIAMSDLKALPCYFEDFDIVQLLSKITERFSPRARQFGLELKFEAFSPITKLVHWDAKRIEQLVSNLLENSLRYTDAPGYVTLSLESTDAYVLIDVNDSLPAVAATDLTLIFEPLYRADNARTRTGSGSGLGLTICSAIVAAHRGSIDAAKSNLGGLAIHIKLPWDAANSEI
jgi:two-component system, OmpR family, sensor histidine kinase BaeS